MDPDYVKRQVKAQQDAYEFSQRVAREQEMTVDKDYIFSVQMWRTRSGIESTISIDVLTCNGVWAKKRAEEFLIGWRSISYTCKGEI